MNARTFVSLFLILALMPGIAPVQADKPAGGAATCRAEALEDGVSNDDGDGIFCEVVSGPDGLNLKPIGNFGLHWSSFLTAAGVYNVDTAAAGNHQLTAWVEQASGLCGVQGIGCGFDI